MFKGWGKATVKESQVQHEPLLGHLKPMAYENRPRCIAINPETLRHGAIFTRLSNNMDTSLKIYYSDCRNHCGVP
jgi:hypothetical protein